MSPDWDFWVPIILAGGALFNAYFHTLDKLQADYAKLESIKLVKAGERTLAAKSLEKLHESSWKEFRLLVLASTLSARVAYLERLAPPIFWLALSTTFLFLIAALVAGAICGNGVCVNKLAWLQRIPRGAIHYCWLPPWLYLFYINWHLVWLRRRTKSPDHYI